MNLPISPCIPTYVIGSPSVKPSRTPFGRSTASLAPKIMLRGAVARPVLVVERRRSEHTPTGVIPPPSSLVLASPSAPTCYYKPQSNLLRAHLTFICFDRVKSVSRSTKVLGLLQRPVFAGQDLQSVKRKFELPLSAKRNLLTSHYFASMMSNLSAQSTLAAQRQLLWKGQRHAKWLVTQL